MKDNIEFIINRNRGWGFQEAQLTYDLPLDMLVLPCSWFNGDWITNPYNIGTEKFFEKSTYQFEPQAVANVNKLKQIFFSTENVKYIQEKLRYEVFASSNNQYRIPYQNERDLRMIMETIYQNKTRNIGYLLNEQLSELNDYVVKFCVPKILNEAKVYLKYLVDIEKLTGFKFKK
jgi:hypothetical protein